MANRKPLVISDGALSELGTTDSLGVTQLVATRANDAANGGGQVYINGASGNRIDMGSAGVGDPTFTTRSPGTKVVFYTNLSPTVMDYAIGVSSATLWSAIPSSIANFKWFGGTTLVATLSGAGKLTLVGDLVSANIPVSGGGTTNFLRADGTWAAPGGGGGGGYTLSTRTAGYTETATSGEIVVLADLAAGFTITLPTAVGNTAKMTFKKMKSEGRITIDANASETIDGGLTAVLADQYEAITLVSNNANWFII